MPATNPSGAVAALQWNPLLSGRFLPDIPVMATTVSIVEDNEQLRATLARVLNRAEGFRCVSQYGDAEAALEGLPKDRPEVVLMDINLPRSEEHTSELQSPCNLVCRLLLEKKKN